MLSCFSHVRLIILTLVFHLHVEFSLSVYMPPNFLLCENTHQTGFGFPLMTSFSLDDLYKDPFFKYGHILRVWGLGLQCIHGVRVCVLSCFSHVWLLVTPWTVAHQAPLSMELSRQEYWSGLMFPPPGDLPNPAIEPASLMSPELAGGFFTSSATWEVLSLLCLP